MKTCSCCKIEKPNKAFGKSKNRKDGLRPYCKACRKAKAAARYERDKDKILARNRQVPLRLRQHYDRTHILRGYGLTVEDYNELYAQQNGRCAICGRHQGELRDAMCVDHCHKTNKVRGLLCRRCNMAIGGLKDDKDLVMRAYEYLNKS